MKAMTARKYGSPDVLRLEDVAKPVPGPGRLLETGGIVPEIETTHPLEELPAAMRHFETEHARSKIVITLQAQDGEAAANG